MATKIEWTEETWNPIVGCTKVSAGCANCYALRRVVMLAHNPKLPSATREKYRSTIHKVNGKWEWSGRLAFFPERLKTPLSWRKPKMVFVCSMSDLFHEDVRREWIAQVFAVAALCPQHTFQILTKRPDRMQSFLARGYGDTCAGIHSLGINLNKLPHYHRKIDDPGGWPLPNVWLGTTCENQAQADKRIPELLKIPAAVRFASVEPMLGTVDVLGFKKCHACGKIGKDALRCPNCGKCSTADNPKLDWVICGGESGHGARPMHPDWARSLRDQCVAAGVPFFFKQWGSKPHVDAFSEANGVCARVESKKCGRVLDGMLWDEMPNAQAGGEE